MRNYFISHNLEMEKIFILVFLVLVIYLLARFLEYRFLNQEEGEDHPSLKQMVRDSIVVGASTVIGGTLFFYLDSHLVSFFNSVMNSDLASKMVDRENIQIFTDDPGF